MTSSLGTGGFSAFAVGKVAIAVRDTNAKKGLRKKLFIIRHDSLNYFFLSLIETGIFFYGASRILMARPRQ